MRQIDADALKDKLQKHHDFFVGAYGSFSSMPLHDKTRVDAITQCIAEVVNAPTIEAKHMKWISVEERLPEKYTIVLCYKDKQWRLGYYIGASYSKGVAAFRHPKDQFAFGVTHWIPLPEPPETED